MPRDADRPLFSDPNGDLFVQSREGGHIFRVARAILAYHSQFFRDLFDEQNAAHAAQRPHEITGAHDHPLILMESTQVLDILFNLMHATGHVGEISSSELFFRSLLAADKYKMENSIRILRSWHKLHAEQSPVLMYAVARKLKWHTEAWNARMAAVLVVLGKESIRSIPTNISINGESCSHFITELLVAREELRLSSVALAERVGDYLHYTYRCNGCGGGASLAYP